MRAVSIISRSVVAIALAGVTVAVAQPPASADPWGCPPNYLCLILGQDGNGGAIPFGPGSQGTYDLGSAGSNQISGWVNNTNSTWWLWEDANWSGDHRALGVGTWGNLGADWNNRATSVERK